MRRIRFTIGAMMGLVSLVAVGFAALRSPSPWWSSSVFTATFLCLSAGVVGAFAVRGPGRQAWMGFSVFGGMYLLGAFWLWPGSNGVTAPPFLSKHLIDSLGPETAGTTLMTFDPGPTGESTRESRPKYHVQLSRMTSVMAPFPGRVVNLLHYRRIGHSFTAIFLGIVGAVLGRLLATRNESGTLPRGE